MAVDVVTIAEEWVYEMAGANAAVTTALGSGDSLRVWPAFAPQGAVFPYCTHDLAGTLDVPKPYGGPPSQWSIVWDVTVWGDSADRQQLRAAMTAMLGALTGDDMRGRAVKWQSETDGSTWMIGCTYRMPVPAPGDNGVSGEGVYQRVCHQVKLEMQRLS